MRERVRGECSVDALGSPCGSWYAEPWSRSFGVRLIPRALLPCLITWRAKQSARECVKTQYLSQPPGALTSCKASPVRPLASGWLPPWVPFFLEALCGRGFGQEFEVPASAVSPCSPSRLLWQIHLLYFFQQINKSGSSILHPGLAVNHISINRHELVED